MVGVVRMRSNTQNYKRLTMVCPHCEERAVVEDSKKVTRLVRELYFRCSNLICGFTFKAQLGIVATISPSSNPHPDVKLASVVPRRAAGRLVMGAANENEPEGQRLPAA